MKPGSMKIASIPTASASVIAGMTVSIGTLPSRFGSGLRAASGRPKTEQQHEREPEAEDRADRLAQDELELGA